MRRLRLSTVVLVSLFVIIAGRLVQIQLTEADVYAANAMEQRSVEIPLPAPRGSILDRTGAILAHSVEARYVYADPSLVEDPEAVAAQLSPLLGIQRSVLAEQMRPRTFDNGEPVRFVYLARGVPIEIGDRVVELDIPGIGVRRDERREVPGHGLASNVIGFTGTDNGEDIVGRTGLEARYDAVLQGVDGVRIQEQGRSGEAIPNGYQRTTPARPGSSLQLTLDRDLQYAVQNALDAQMRQMGAYFGAAVVLEARTGEILALASWPTYDAANPRNVTPEQLMDYATGAVVEPGSVHKAIVIAAALEEGIITPESTPVVPPSIERGGEVYTDTHPHDTRPMTIAGILAHSSNVGTIQIADELGAQRLYEYQRAFGLGTSTSCGLPGEASGIVQPPENWSGSSYGSIPLGLGVAVTPLQMTAAYAAIANDGVWVQPHLVQGIINADGEFQPAEEPERRRVISEQTAAQMRQLLEAPVVAEGGTAHSAQIEGYRVAGKTGTGMRVVDGEYAPGDIASFVGMAPADDPRFVVGVFAHVPSGGGGGVAGPVFADVMRFALQRYAVPPTGTTSPHFEIYA